MLLKRTGPCKVLVSDVLGPAFSPVHEQIEIISLVDGQELDLTIHFEYKNGNTHARYSPCAAVGMEKVSDGVHRIRFETIDGTPGKEMLLRALDALEKRFDSALLQLANQPTTPPKSKC